MVEGTGLENRSGFTPAEGSNPSLSATALQKTGFNSRFFHVSCPAAGMAGTAAERGTFRISQRPGSPLAPANFPFVMPVISR